MTIFVVERRMPNVGAADLAPRLCLRRLTSRGEPVSRLGPAFLPDQAGPQVVRRCWLSVTNPFPRRLLATRRTRCSGTHAERRSLLRQQQRIHIGRKRSERRATSTGHPCQTLLEAMAAAPREMNDQLPGRVDCIRQLVEFRLFADHQRSPLDPRRSVGTANGKQFANLLEAEPTAA